MPIDIFFVWVVFWSIIPAFQISKNYTLLFGLIILWLDVIFMPILEKYGLLKLSKNWLWAELILVIAVFIPSYYWAYLSYNNKKTPIRSLLQIVIVIAIYIFCLPYLMKNYGVINSLNHTFSSLTFQLFFIIAFPGIIATYYLTTVGNGTPFPFDKTKILVKTGIYAYIKNPIQWSLTFIFIPLCIQHNSWTFLIGCLISIFYSLSIANNNEQEDMSIRFGESYNTYKNEIPSWFFSWTPKNYPKGKIFFDTNCQTCSDVKKWFESEQIDSLEILSSQHFKGKSILQLTYLDKYGNEFKSIKAISAALQHINLAYACLGWFMTMPIISDILQLIVDSFEINKICEVKQ